MRQTESAGRARTRRRPSEEQTLSELGEHDAAVRRFRDGGSAYPRPLELLLYGVAPLATLISAPILARSLGPVGRGEFGVAMSVSTFALTLSAWGQAETYLVEARAGRLGYRQQTLIAFFGGLLVAALSAVALVLLGLPLVTAMITAAWIPFLNQANLWRAVAVSSGRLKPPALSNAIGPIIRIVLLVVLALTSLISVDSSVTATQLANTVGAVITVGLVSRLLLRGYRDDRVPVRRLLQQGSAVITFDVFNALALRSDLIVLQIFASAHQVGLYAAPSSLTGSALALSIGFKSRMQASAVARKPGATIVRESIPVLVLAAAGAILLWFIAPWLVDVFFGAEYAGSIPILRLLGIATVPLLMLDLAQGVLVVLAERRSLILVGACDAAVVVLSLAVLSPIAAGVGAAIACIIGYTVAAVLGWTIVLRSLRRSDAAA
jgi:O-antigen/teichoic acid export membrane protein